MQAHVDVHNLAMHVPQGRLHLHVLPIYGAVCQCRAPDPTGRSADDIERTFRGDRDREEREAAQAHEGREDSDARRRIGERGWTRQIQARIISTNGN